MNIKRTELDLREELDRIKSENKDLIVGFVPTMGALHHGHAQLIKKAIEQSDFVVVSVFVNPTQFNKEADLENYPRTEEADIELLRSLGCDLLFLPSIKDVYPDSLDSKKIDLNGLDLVMEGAFRPGHFDGVVTVVNRFFEIVQPTKAFFGKKDFQQLAIINRMVEVLEWEIQIIGIDIQRSIEGLALSSRNSLLSDQELKDALIIHETMTFGKSIYKDGMSTISLKSDMEAFFNKGNLELEYLSIIDNKSLQEVTTVNEDCTVCIAAYCGEVRLIDNTQFGDF
ncbi:MAG: pantoate--beta-alanine ligase [Crocinitomix sp. MedPE-SWsnd]|nr:MAG: pantoate--beta-alanine ligase [Crocinitomix sp. MedPE-SWsnd]